VASASRSATTRNIPSRKFEAFILFDMCRTLLKVSLIREKLVPPDIVRIS
jgi:hypothetical protein